MSIAERHSVSLGYETVTNLGLDWTGIRNKLDTAGIDTVYLSAGRAEWVTFDWPAHPNYVAGTGKKYLDKAIAATKPADESERNAVLMIDAFIPELIKKNPSWAGVKVNGTRNTYTASVSAVLNGPVGDLYAELAVELVNRYHPYMVTFTELQFDATFGADDFALFKEMTGRSDWPRTSSGAINTSSTLIASWRSKALSRFLARVRDEMHAVDPEVKLGMDVAMDWSTPGGGRSDIGHGYKALGPVVDQLILWAYIGLGSGRTPRFVARTTEAIQKAELSAPVTISIGLWAGDDESDTLDVESMAYGVLAGETHGVTSTNITPFSRLTDAHWSAINDVW